MSAEDRWIRIENALAMLSEHQANAEVLAATRRRRPQRAGRRRSNVTLKVDKEMAELRQLSKASDERLDRHIVFVTAAIAKTAAAQEVTEEQLEKLISKVDGVDDRVTMLEKKKP